MLDVHFINSKMLGCQCAAPTNGNQVGEKKPQANEALDFMGENAVFRSNGLRP